MNVESWCTVESTAKQGPERAERKHYQHAFDSKIFKQNATIQTQPRLTEFKVSGTKHKERRHFPENRKCEKIITNEVLKLVKGQLAQVENSNIV